MSSTEVDTGADLGDVQRLLLPTETIQWTGRPQQGLAFAASDVAFVPATGSLDAATTRRHGPAHGA